MNDATDIYNEAANKWSLTKVWVVLFYQNHYVMNFVAMVLR